MAKIIRLEIREVPGIPNIGASKDGRLWRITEPMRNGSNKNKKVPYELAPVTMRKNKDFQFINVYGLDGPGSHTTKYIHELVARTFNGPRPDGYEIDHNDRDRSNNAASNLIYRTRSQHCQKHAPQRAARLTPEKVRHILRCKTSARELSERYECARSMVYAIRSGGKWHAEWVKYQEELA